jgi:hypothetical protein
MKTLRGRTLAHLLLVLAIAVLPVAGCSSVSGSPTIPPEETFIIPFEDFTPFEEFTETNGLISLAESGNHSNWNYAVFAVVTWGAILITTLAVPVAAFRASFQHTPVQQPDGSWLWSYSVNITGSVYTAELHAQFITGGVHWDMNISKEGEYEDFLWYYGENDLPATEGFWILKQSPAVPTDLLRIDWSRNISAGTHAIRYTNIIPGDSNNGGYIDTQYTKDIPYNHIWDMYNKVADNHTYIEWSSTTGEGRIKNFNLFGDDNWHCWDSDRMNVTCS